MSLRSYRERCPVGGISTLASGRKKRKRGKESQLKEKTGANNPETKNIYINMNRGKPKNENEKVHRALGRATKQTAP
jgi:hypothetical protein